MSQMLVAHIVHRLDYGGLENGLVNLINLMPPERYRHAVICMTDYSAFKERIRRPDVELFALHKRTGKDLPVYVRLWRLLRELRPAIVHSRNFGTMDCAVIARLAGVGVRVHGEHGWDIVNLRGENARHRRLRKLFDKAVSRYVVVSEDLGRWLVDSNGVAPARVEHIMNGVDVERFRPREGQRGALPEHLRDSERIVFGTVCRMHPVKNPVALARAYAKVHDKASAAGRKVGLVMVGDGPLRDEVRHVLESSGCLDSAWLPGARDDIPELLREIDAFVLPSLNEGISNTILESMASGIAVIAADVGGNRELVVHGETGLLTSECTDDAFASAMESYLDDPASLRRHGDAGRRRAVERFALASMVSRYVELYDQLIRRG